MATFCESLKNALSERPWDEWPALPGRTNHIRCGVVVPIREEAGRPVVYAGARSQTLGNHAGEVCFPGGRPEANDADYWATAQREASEELGITGLVQLGRFSSVPLYTSDYRLEPYLGLLAEDVTPEPDGHEIVELLPIDLIEVLERPALLGIPWVAEGSEHISPVFEVGSYLMYGGTAYVFLELLSIAAPLLGFEVPPMTKSHYRWQDILPGIT